MDKINEKINELLGTQEIKDSIENKIKKEIEKDVIMKFSNAAYSRNTLPETNKQLPEKYSNFLLTKDILVKEMKEKEKERQQKLTAEATDYMKTRLEEHNKEINNNNILGRCFRTWYIIGTSKLVPENNRFKFEWNSSTTNFVNSTASHIVFPGTLYLDFLPIGQFLQLQDRNGTLRTNADAAKTEKEKQFNKDYKIFFNKIKSKYMTMGKYVKTQQPPSGGSRKSLKSRKYRKSHTRRNR
jgi:hypothetical protein